MPDERDIQAWFSARVAFFMQPNRSNGVDKNMKTTFATALLTIAFLSAGAFANGNNGNQGTTKPLASLANKMIVIKN